MISTSDYKAIVCLIVESESALSQSYSAMLNAQQALNSSTMTDTKRAFLQQPLTDALQKMASQITDPLSEMVAAITAIQRHVELNYGPINTFLSSHSITVPEAFAALSEKAGYSIDSRNIADSC